MNAYALHNEIDHNQFLGDLINLVNNLNLEGEISRISPIPGLFYVVENKSQRTYGIDMSQIQGFRGETAKELGIKVGAKVQFCTTDDPRIVASAKVLR